MESLLSESLQSKRYRGCKTTTLESSALVELGRAMAHHGLLVERVREFVTYVGFQTHILPPLIASSEAIRLFPCVVASIQTAFRAEERYFLDTALEFVANAEEALDRFRYSHWGTDCENYEVFGRCEYRQSSWGGCHLDRMNYTAKTLHNLAMDMSLAIKHVAKIQWILQERINEDPKRLTKRIGRRLARHINQPQSKPVHIYHFGKGLDRI